MTLEQRPVPQYMKVSEFTIDPRIQRQFLRKQADKVLDDWRDFAIDAKPFVVNHREDGFCSLLDGLQSVERLKERGEGSREVLALVYRGLTFAEESLLFATLNNTTPVSASIGLSREFQAGVHRAVGMVEALRRNGYRFSFDKEVKGTVLKPIKRIEKLYDDGVIDRVLYITSHAWPSKGLEASILGAVGLFVKYQRGQYDLKSLILNLGKYSPSIWVSESATARNNGTKQDWKIYEAMVDEYNKGRLERNRLVP